MCVFSGDQLFVLELHKQREVGGSTDSISSRTPAALAHMRTHTDNTHDSRVCQGRNELQLTAGGRELECSASKDCACEGEEEEEEKRREGRRGGGLLALQRQEQ